LRGKKRKKMPADIMEKNSSSPVAATPASVNTTPDKPKTASEHRKVRTVPVFLQP
jgi:hairy and enhancer of split protein 1